MKPFYRTCPICGGEKGPILHTQLFQVEEGFPLCSQYDLVECGGCGFVFADTTSDQTAYDRYYSTFSKYEDPSLASGTGSSEADKERLAETAGVIERILDDKEASILDIGTGNGGMLRELMAKGHINVMGLDPSLACIAYMTANGINAKHGSLSEPLAQTLNRSAFACIILSHVLEHILDPDRVIKNVSTVLKPDGKLYIEVPDASRYADFYRVPYYYFDVEHINHFTPFALTTLLMKNGFEQVEWGIKDIAISPTIRYPSFYGIYQLKRKELSDSIRRYLQMSATLDTTDRMLEPLLEKGEDIVVWGAGNFTKRLLASTSLRKAKIVFFVDKDSNKQGKMLNGIDIYSETALNAFEGYVVIASALYGDEIAQEIAMRFPHLKTLILR